MVTTHSALSMWWHTYVLGYRVRMTKRVPRQALSGRIRYASEWVLDPGDH